MCCFLSFQWILWGWVKRVLMLNAISEKIKHLTANKEYIIYNFFFNKFTFTKSHSKHSFIQISVPNNSL